MITNKIESERLTFPNENKRYSEDKTSKSLLSLNTKINNKKNITRRNSAKGKGFYEKDEENKIKKKSLSG